jgi:hypothetical protein
MHGNFAISRNDLYHDTAKPLTQTELDFAEYGPLYAARKKVYPQTVSRTCGRTCSTRSSVCSKVTVASA